MAPPKVGGPRQFARVTRQTWNKKERIAEPTNIMEVEDATTSETESLSPKRVEEEKSSTEEMEVDQSVGQRQLENPNLKNLHVEVKVAQEEKQARQAQLDPLQDQAKQMITMLEIEKVGMEQAHEDNKEALKEHMTVQDVEIIAEKSVQAKDKETYLAQKFHALEVALQKVNQVWVARDEP
jgi:hypothetical protein